MHQQNVTNLSLRMNFVSFGSKTTNIQQIFVNGQRVKIQTNIQK